MYNQYCIHILMYM